MLEESFAVSVMDVMVVAKVEGGCFITYFLILNNLVRV